MGRANNPARKKRHGHKATIGLLVPPHDSPMCDGTHTYIWTKARLLCFRPADADGDMASWLGGVFAVRPIIDGACEERSASATLRVVSADSSTEALSSA